jgi:hypothetical protein
LVARLVGLQLQTPNISDLDEFSGHADLIIRSSAQALFSKITGVPRPYARNRPRRKGPSPVIGQPGFCQRQGHLKLPETDSSVMRGRNSTALSAQTCHPMDGVLVDDPRSFGRVRPSHNSSSVPGKIASPRGAFLECAQFQLRTAGFIWQCDTRRVLAGPASRTAEQARNDAQDARWNVKKESMMILTTTRSWDGENLDLNRNG